MNGYRVVLQDTSRVLRGTWQVWIFGFLALASSAFVSVAMDGLYAGTFVVWQFIQLLFFGYLLIVSQSSLAHSALELLSGRQPRFEDSWAHCHARILALTGIYLFSQLFGFVAQLFVGRIDLSTDLTSLAWLPQFGIETFSYTVMIGGACAILLSDHSTISALQATLRIVATHWKELLVYCGCDAAAIYLLNVISGNGLFAKVLFVPFLVLLAAAYRKYASESSDPKAASSESIA